MKPDPQRVQQILNKILEKRQFQHNLNILELNRKQSIQNFKKLQSPTILSLGSTIRNFRNTIKIVRNLGENNTNLSIEK